MTPRFRTPLESAVELEISYYSLDVFYYVQENIHNFSL